MEFATNYQVVRANSLNDLVDRVRNLLGNGWVPTGGVTVVEADGNQEFYQAVVQYPIVAE